MKKTFRIAVIIVGFLGSACLHATPKENVLGKPVRLGEIKGDSDTQRFLKTALEEHFIIQAAEGLRINAEAWSSGYDETVLNPPASSQLLQLERRVQTLRIALQLVDDKTGKVVAGAEYEMTERGFERPQFTLQQSQQTDDLTLTLVRRAVYLFIRDNKL